MRSKGRRPPVTVHGVVIYNIRKSHHLTQKQFAKLIGTTQGTVSNWEIGRTKRIPRFWWKAIKKHFGVDIGKVLDDGK